MSAAEAELRAELEAARDLLRAIHEAAYAPFPVIGRGGWPAETMLAREQHMEDMLTRISIATDGTFTYAGNAALLRGCDNLPPYPFIGPDYRRPDLLAAEQ